jgi:transcriptional regulator with XRE-family HTH domain
MAAEGPTARRRRLASELKKSRERAGLTQEQVAKHFEWSGAKVTRMETARVGVTTRDVKDLLNLYGVEDDTYREALIALSRQSRERTWVTGYRDILRGSYISLEAEAAAVRWWEPALITGLLQTEDYARALITAYYPPEERRDVERHVELRMARQTRLTVDDPLYLSAVIDESALYRVIGGPAVMRAQLQRLQQVVDLNNVIVQILPRDAGAHAMLGGQVAIVEFPEASHLDVVYMEGIASDNFIEQPNDIARWKREYDRVRAMALSADDSQALIGKAIRAVDSKRGRYRSKKGHGDAGAGPQ